MRRASARSLDDITVSTEAGTESFETGLGAWTVAGPPPGSAVNGNDWTRTTDVGFEEGAVVAMTPATTPRSAPSTSGSASKASRRPTERNAVMGRAIDYLTGP